jgi:undecaprenyl diphosphate synthase
MMPAFGRRRTVAGESTLPEAERLPKHVVLIPDGNGRWAAARGLPVAEGHRRGAEAVKAFLRVCRDWNIPFATVWAFSTENWGRNPAEVDAIMNLVEVSLRQNRKGFRRDGIRFRHLGRRDRIGGRYPRLGRLLADLEQETSANQPFTLNLALDYGGRDEVVRAVRDLVAAPTEGGEVTWDALAARLDTAGQPDPDLVIRSSGEQRLSGILPLQAAYAEMIFIPRFLPDLAEEDFREAIRGFAGRERRFGVRPQGGEGVRDGG